MNENLEGIRPPSSGDIMGHPATRILQFLNSGGKASKGFRASKLASVWASMSAKMSKWISGTKWTNWFKVGAAGGIGYTIYHAWGSGVDTIADATGLSSDTVESLLFLAFGMLAAYIAARLLFPDNGSTTINVGGTSVTRTASKSSQKSSKRSSGRTSKKGSSKKKGGRT